jgi:hypothetical protein
MSVTLPDEIWGLVLVQLPRRHLLSVSLVSRALQRLAFSHLYHTVWFLRPRYLEQLAHRITSDHVATLSVRTHIRVVSIGKKNNIWIDDPNGGNYIGEQHLGYLMTILLAVATRLQEFSWQLPFLPRGPEVLQLLQTGCPNLRTFEMTIFEDSGGFYSGRFRRYGL